MVFYNHKYLRGGNLEPVTIFIENEHSNNFEEVAALIVLPDKLDSFDLIETHFVAKRKEHFIAFPRKYIKQILHRYEIVKV